MAAFAQAHNMALLPYGVVAGGFLSDNYLGTSARDVDVNTYSKGKYASVLGQTGGWSWLQQLLQVRSWVEPQCLYRTNCTAQLPSVNGTLAVTVCHSLHLQLTQCPGEGMGNERLAAWQASACQLCVPHVARAAQLGPMTNLCSALFWTLCRCCGLSPTSTTPVCQMLPAAGSCSALVSLLSSLGPAMPCMCLTTSSCSASALMLTTRQQYRRCWRQGSNPRAIATAGKGVAHSEHCTGSVDKLWGRAGSCAVVYGLSRQCN